MNTPDKLPLSIDDCADLVKQAQQLLDRWQDNLAAQFMRSSLQLPVEFPQTDPWTIINHKQRMAMREACEWLRAGAPGRALEVLENALKP